jgi:hypothetical protein
MRGSWRMRTLLICGKGEKYYRLQYYIVSLISKICAVNFEEEQKKVYWPMKSILTHGTKTHN